MAFAEPPLPGSGEQPYPEMDFPYNYAEYEKTGKIPEHVEIRLPKDARPLLMRTPYAEFWPSGSISGSADDIHIAIGNRPNGVATGNARETSLFRFRAVKSSVFPIFDDLYFVEQLGDSLAVLKRVTSSMPIGIVPSERVRLLPANSVCMPLFHNKKAHAFGGWSREGWVTVKRIEASVEPHNSPTALVEVQAPYPNTFEECRDNPPTPREVTIKKGDLLTTKYQSYRVLKIVPPQEVVLRGTGTGNFVGWIEIDPKPVGAELKGS